MIQISVDTIFLVTHALYIVRVSGRKRLLNSFAAHHQRKVLRTAIHPSQPTVFLSCSADGTVRRFDTRVAYKRTHSHPTGSDWHSPDAPADSYIFPQAYGGGRSHRVHEKTAVLDTLLLKWPDSTVVYGVDWHPLREHLFLAAPADGNTRLFDTRMIRSYSPFSHVNVYRSIDLLLSSQYVPRRISRI